MARTEARIQTAIWHDDDFLALSSDAQRLYFVALSQPNVNFCGVVDYTARRWARLAPDSSARKVEAAVARLVEKRFVVVDADTEELLIRTFIRHDGVLSSPNLIIAMSKDFGTIHSTLVRSTVLDLLGEGFVEGLTEGVREGLAKPFRQGFAQHFRNGSREGARAASTSTTNPYPPPPSSTPVVEPLASSSRRANGRPDDDDGNDPDTTEETLEAAFRLIATRLLEQRNAELVERGRPDEVIPATSWQRVKGWLATTGANEREHFDEVARAYLADDSTLTGAALAELLAPALVVSGAWA